MWHVLMIDHYCSSYILEMSTLLCVCSVTCDVRRCVPGVRAQPADRQCSDPSNTPHRLSDFDFGCPDAHVVTWHGCFRVTRVKQNCCLIVSMQFRFCRGHNQRTQSQHNIYLFELRWLNTNAIFNHVHVHVMHLNIFIKVGNILCATQSTQNYTESMDEHKNDIDIYYFLNNKIY